MPPPTYTLAAYYFPNFHPDVRNSRVHGAGWTEWDLVRLARPRFPGHYQPRQPLWGYTDESDPAVMEQKINAAADHGISIFLYDWYYYDDGPFLERGLEQGYLQATNNQRMRFAIHWANHDWTDIHPARRVECLLHNQHLLYPGRVTPQTFSLLTDYVIKSYFTHPAYWTINGAPYFSIYDLPSLVASLGGVDGTRHALDAFRQKTIIHGFPDLHLNQVLWNTGILSGESVTRQPGKFLKMLNFDSFTSYVWVHHAPLATFPEVKYQAVLDTYLHYWEQQTVMIDLPYFPNVTMGWDSSPRTVQSDVFDNAGYPFTPVIAGNSPENFGIALKTIKTRLEQTNGPRIITLNAWNEWTEGSYLEPDTQNGYAYLEAIRDVFSTSAQS